MELFLLAFRFYITSTIKLSTLLIILSKFPFTLRRFIRYYNAWTFIHHLHVMLVNAVWMQHHLHVMLVIFNNGSLCDSLCCVVFRLYSAFSWLIKQLNLFPPWNRFFFFFFFFFQFQNGKKIPNTRERNFVFSRCFCGKLKVSQSAEKFLKWTPVVVVKVDSIARPCTTLGLRM